ncbi:SDR family NAD(P)-dependent oxidoreductase [Paracoccus sp. p3-h83]|uniref:SDR family NAD(P)-dependent oxidoreductase n=1 Tax=Paracoccus sp. p3-h83 TaxID=3342805 RepID=UPI0035B8FA16
MIGTWSCIVITGASGGIGAALARELAGPGRHLALFGRDPDRLAATADLARAQGATASLHPVDVTCAPAMAQALAELDARHPIDLLIAGAGIAAPGRETADDARAITRTNVDGLLNTVDPVIALMRARGRGQIGVVSSLAGFRALGGPPAYAASKAWARLYAEALRGQLARHGIGVSVICPGFVDTPMVDAATRARVGGLVPAPRAARIIARGLAANAARISFPTGMALRVWWLAAAPVIWTDRHLRARLRKARR